jgi:hypothetical protein
MVNAANEREFSICLCNGRAICSHSDFTILSMADIDRVCVELFPLSGTRMPIMDGLERFLQRLLAGNITGDIWADGS